MGKFNWRWIATHVILHGMHENAAMSNVDPTTMTTTFPCPQLTAQRDRQTARSKSIAFLTA